MEDVEMKIIDTRHVTPDDYKIKNVQVKCSWSARDPKYIYPYLTVTLEPEKYFRDRFSQGGASYEKKKHGARELIIGANELRQMMDALNREMQTCYDVILDNDLMPALAEARKQKQAQSAKGDNGATTAAQVSEA
jgi:hypothetical protein